jgi:hypothetical protein
MKTSDPCAHRIAPIRKVAESAKIRAFFSATFDSHPTTGRVKPIGYGVLAWLHACHTAVEDFKEESSMEKIMDSTAVPEIQTEIEELEAKIAPDGGETVLPLVPVHHHK